ncbi:5778_t:CDS:2 [Funneliformis mosseae]|uniref:5778_t:CDS:1 n=1 Tax=Funneliformis mosseae TaxID=27381 RepID=A0A9N9D5Q7_FUNMO|nr:5778_t:CDS:2 [Funneliformis mosseae]
MLTFYRLSLSVAKLLNSDFLRKSPQELLQELSQELLQALQASQGLSQKLSRESLQRYSQELFVQNPDIIAVALPQTLPEIQEEKRLALENEQFEQSRMEYQLKMKELDLRIMQYKSISQ